MHMLYILCICSLAFLFVRLDIVLGRLAGKWLRNHERLRLGLLLCGCVTFVNRINTKAVYVAPLLQLLSRYRCVIFSLNQCIDSNATVTNTNVTRMHKGSPSLTRV